ncbi:MAG TPA: VWA domain-containing protein [Bryobacteraceae bacterium]|nr:VWA domain-containing protein [Bryobacteraceae bacterium]
MKQWAAAACLVTTVALAQNGGQTGGQTEMSQKDEPVTFQTHVNLVMVPVVVRDKNGRAVGHLEKNDFLLFDKGKPQQISRFTVEKWDLNGLVTEAKETAPGEGSDKLPPANMPDRFVGYLFDDVHVNAGDLMRLRQAAEQHMQNELRPSDRAAIFTTSGQVVTDFTDDLGKLHATLQRLMPRPIARTPVQQCPDISLYQADLIINRNDSQALAAATMEVQACMSPPDQKTAQQMAQNAAQQVLSPGHHETQVSLSVIMDVLMRMAAMPGQRNLILVSPGFYLLNEDREDENRLLDRAIRANVVINALNARGLYTMGADASRRTYSAAAQTIKDRMERESAMADEGIMEEVAAGTGGRYFHNNNDLLQGFHELASLPEYYYLLGFQPQNLKLDGSFHAVKVSLAAKGDYTLQARRGYYAPRRLEDPAETAKREISEALFSREEMHDIPVELHTQFSHPGGDKATVAVLAHVDLKRIHFKKENGRNVDRLTVVAGLFDRSGNYVTGLTKTIDFHLKDETLASRLGNGITVRTALETKPGTYMVRLVVRDDEGQLMSAANGAVDIP